MKLTDLKSFGNRIASRSRESYSIIKEEIRSYYSENSSEDQDLKDRIKEKDLSQQLLRISLIAFASKTFYYLAQQGWLTAVLSVLGFILSIPVLVWTNAWSLYGMAFPLLSGIAMMVITWYTIFLDSYIPGVYPVSPLSPKKNGLYPSHIHLGYIIAVANGITLALLLYLGSVSV